MVSTTVQEIIQCRRKGAPTLQLQLDHWHTSSSDTRNNDGHDNLPRILTTLAQVRRVEIPLQPFYVTEPQWDDLRIAEILRALGELELLESVTLQARTLRGNPFPIGLLTHLLWPGRHRLRYLHMDVQRLQCLSRATRRVAQTLEQQTCLEWVKFKYSKLLTNTSNTHPNHLVGQADDNDSENDNNSLEAPETIDFGSINPILRSLAKIPTLKHVQWVGTCEGEDNEFAFDDFETEVFPTMDASSLLQLLKSSSLRELRLEWMDLDATAIGSLGAALQWPTTSRLEKLVLGLFPEDAASFKVFAGMLHHNQTLQVVHVHTSWRAAEASLLFGSMVKKSHYGTLSSMEKFLVLIGKALCCSTKTRTCLHEFHLCGPTMESLTPRAQDALVLAMKSNFVLTSLKIGTRDSREGEIGGPIEYYLKLNQLDRKRFVQQYEQVTTEEWIAVLAQAGCDLDSVFYFLRLNPFLCQTAGYSPAATRKSTIAASLGLVEEDPLLLEDHPSCSLGASALTQAVANMIENVATTMEIELLYRDERERELEEEVQRLRMELADLKACRS